MSNTTTSPNMNLPVPVVGVDPGPDFATNLVQDMYIIDGHNHTPGNGVPITPAGLSINADLPFNSNNAVTLRSVRFFPQTAALSAAADLGCLYEVGQDLWWTNGGGTAVQITSGSSVNAGAGSIAGLPSGTASVTFAPGAASTYTFLAATSTPATIVAGTVQIGTIVAGTTNFVSLASPTLSASYTMTLPAALPSSTLPLTLAASGAVTTQSTLALTSLAVGPTAAPTFKMQRFTGSIGPSGSVTLTVSGTVLGAIGMATYQGVGNGFIPMGVQINGQCTFTDTVAVGTVGIGNGGGGAVTENYDVTVFYV